MRDIKRIEPLLETLRKIWLEHPDYRLMQLFGNVYRGDPYYIEDDDLLQRLESTYLPERDACINAEIPVALEKAGSLEHSLSAALLHVCLLRERGDNTEADRIMTELLAAFDKAKQEPR